MSKAVEIDESYWKNIKFNLLFFACCCVVYIIVTKFLLKTPEFDNTEMLSRINDFEKIQVLKNDYTKKSQEIFKTIDTIKLLILYKVISKLIDSIKCSNFLFNLAVDNSC